MDNCHDVTQLAIQIGELVARTDLRTATSLLPIERIYPTPPDVAERIGIT
jgi:hypothetical protein